jgi:hemin uptake protein HemP
MIRLVRYLPCPTAAPAQAAPRTMNENPANTPGPNPSDRTPDRRGPATISSSDVLRGEREVLIDHQGEIYRLTLTRSGKLILHK